MQPYILFLYNILTFFFCLYGYFPPRPPHFFILGNIFKKIYILLAFLKISLLSSSILI